MKGFLIITCLFIASGYSLAPPKFPNILDILPALWECLIPSPTVLSTINAATINIQYYLSSNTVRDPVELNDDNLILINSSIPTKIVVHGWLQNISVPMYAGFRAAYFQRGNYNVIAVDWSQYSSYIDYIESAYYVPRVGKALGQFLQKLHVDFGIPFTSMHLIGFSFGAHVVGFAGKEVQASNNGSMINRITGLDPAGPCFGMPPKPASGRLDGSDATSVEAIHTDQGFLGIVQDIGKVDFRPNGGKRVQPGCNDFLSFTIDGLYCSHNRSTELYIASILSDSMVVHLTTGDLICGENTPAATTGAYSFKTTSVAPYGMN